MIEVARKSSYLFGLQAASFLMLLIFCLNGGYGLVAVLPLIIIEAVTVFQFKNGIRRILILWQMQFFLVAMFGLIFNPSSLLNTSVVRVSVQIFLIAVLLIIEIAVLSIFRLNERGVIGVLKGSTISLIFIVILLFAVVGSEGMAGLCENNAQHMLTSDTFDPYAEPDTISSLNLTVVSQPYDFELSVSNSVVHMAPNSERTINLTVSNIGALNDSYEIASSNDNGIGFTLGLQRIDIDAEHSASFNAIITSNNIGNFSIGITIEDTISKIKNYSIQTIVANEGFDFNESHIFLNVRNSRSSQIFIPIGLMNTGIIDDDFRIKIDSSSIFHPSLSIPEWNNTNNDAIIHLVAGEVRNCSLLPRMLNQVDGQFQINVTAISLQDDHKIAVLNIILRIVNNQYVYPLDSGSIPVSLGHATLWTVEVKREGVNIIFLKSVHAPDGLNVTVLLNGSTIKQIKEGSPIQLDENGSALVILSLNQTDQSFVDGSSLGVQFVTPGSQLQFGILGLMVGSFIITGFALIIAVPLALGSAIFLAYYCPANARRVIKPTMEIIAGIPSVVFGLWGALTFGPFLAQTLYPLINGTLGSFIPFFRGNYNAGSSIMTASIVLGIMIFPIIMALSYEAMAAVPSELVEGSRAMGVTKWQSIRTVVLRKAKSGILGSIILGTGRAIGETMAVLMILGFTPNIPTSIFGITGTMTSSIAATLLSVFSVDQARNGIFAIAFLLFLFVLVLDALLILVTREKSKSNNPRRRMKKINPIQWLLPSRFSLKSSATRDKHEMAQNIKKLFNSSASLRRKDLIASGGLYFVSGIMLVIIAYIILDIVFRGGLAFKLTYLTETQLNGGFLNAITGSLMLVGLALVIAVPITLMAAIYVNEFTRSNSLLSRITYIAVSTLSSTPSIIFGAFGFILFILILDFGFSLLSGGLTLAIMIIPLIYVSSIEGLKTVPNTYREASLALGASKWKTVIGVIIPISLPSITSGIFISIGRAIGETAAILLTAGFALFITTSIADPVASMPNLIYNLFGTSVGNTVLMQKVYAAAFLIIVIVIALNILGKIISHRYEKGT